MKTIFKVALGVVAAVVGYKVYTTYVSKPSSSSAFTLRSARMHRTRDFNFGKPCFRPLRREPSAQWALKSVESRISNIKDAYR
jgi:hypothetical protein